MREYNKQFINQVKYVEIVLNILGSKVSMRGGTDSHVKIFVISSCYSNHGYHIYVETSWIIPKIRIKKIENSGILSLLDRASSW